MSKNLLGRVLLNQYRIDSFIAAGGMGAVYKVWDLKRNVPLAMKVLQNDLVDDPSAFKYFQREARALQRLAHPNIVPFYGLYQTEELAFILEQFVDGPDLRDILRKQPNGMPIPDAMMYMKALCSALGYAHANEVVHCDIKPGNVMINSGGQIYLADFGIARHAQSTTTTIAGAGTPAYMAPEQIRGEQVTPATDVYELGILFFELLTGRRPFRGDEPESLAGGNTSGERIRYAHLNLQPINPSRLNSGIPQALSAVVLKALSKAPRGRYADAQSFYLAACQAIGRTPEAIPDHLPGQTGFPVAGPTPTPAPAPRNAQPAKAKGKYAMLVGGGVVLLLIAFLFIPKGPIDIPTAIPFVDTPTVVVLDNPTDAPPVVPPPQDPTSIVVIPTDAPIPTDTDLPPTDVPIPTDTNPSPTDVPIIPTDTNPPPAPLVSPKYNFAFVSDRGNPTGQMSVYLANPDNLSDRQEIGVPLGYTTAFWPSFCGNKLAVEAPVNPNDDNTDQHVYWLDLASGIWSTPPIPGSSTDKLGVPRCSPDGRYLAYSDQRNGNYDLVISDLRNGKIVFDPGSYGVVTGYVSWARDLSFVYMVKKSPPMLYYSASPNSQSSQIPLEKGSGTYPAISPDGRQIAFTCGDAALCVSNVDGTGIRTIHTLSWQIKIPYWTAKGMPVWSADGNWIYFTSWDEQGNDWDIFRIHPGGGGLQNVTRDWPTNEMMPATH